MISTLVQHRAVDTDVLCLQTRLLQRVKCVYVLACDSHRRLKREQIDIFGCSSWLPKAYYSVLLLYKLGLKKLVCDATTLYFRLM